MPYTPPSHRSPSSSAPVSPDASRRPSFHSQTNGSRPSLPRSASYLTRNRRTPSVVEPEPAKADQFTPEAISEDLKGMVNGMNNSSVRQSPPPVTDERRIPNGAILSPPASPPESPSDDDEEPNSRGRQIENLRALQLAISQIPQHRESSPNKDKADAGNLFVLPSQASALTGGLHQSFSTGSLEELAGTRRFSHTRSATEPNAVLSKSTGHSLTGSEEDSEDDSHRKPQMVRKKSGELVRPALRPPSRRRPSSMPGTPTFSKAVHFDSHLEHVRHFLQVDRPLAVSAGSSPVDNESDGEYPFPSDDRSGPRSPPFEWEIIMTNFPLDTPARKAQPVRLERVWLSNDQKCLIGSVAVINLAFQKYVTCRFTLDYWKTTSEVTAEYMCEITPRVVPNGHDRFNFTIKLSDLANLESKTLYFCIRYNVNGQELWENNSGTNFQVDFKKKLLPQNGKKNSIGAASLSLNGLPRSQRRANPSTVPRPTSMPDSLDDFGEAPKINFDQSIHEYLGESNPPLRLKGVKSSGNIPSDNLSSRLSAPSGQAFANRYDFGASLTAAIQTAKDGMSTKSDGLYMKPNKKPTSPAPSTKIVPKPRNGMTALNPALMTANKPVSGMESPGSASISSSSYEELVNKYCFFGTKPPRFDGADGGPGTNSTTSSNGSPLQMQMPRAQPRTEAQHHTLHPRDPNPYFQHSSLNFMSSPVQSPIQSLAVDRLSSPSTGQLRLSPSPAPATGRSLSPASMVGSFSPFGTSPDDFAYQPIHDRFPFSGAEAHSATAIRG